MSMKPAMRLEKPKKPATVAISQASSSLRPTALSSASSRSVAAKPGSFTREAIVVAVSAENECLYCVTSHGAALRILGKDPVVADQIATNWRTADITPRLRAILTFASRVNEPGFAATDRELAELKAVGLSDEDAWDIATVAGFFGFSNRMAGFMDMRHNPQVYDMGRQPR